MTAMAQERNHPASRSELLLLLGLFALVLLLRVPGVPQPFDNDSAAIGYHGRLINEGLPLYGEHHPGHHMPAVYYTYAAVFRLLGDSVSAIKLALILWTFLLVVVVYRTGALLFDRTTALTAAVFCALLSSDLRLAGLTGEIELWANLPRALGVYLVVRALVLRAPSWQWGLVGLFGAWSIAFKAVYVSPLAVGGAVAAIEYLRGRAEPGALGLLLRRACWVVGGAVVGTAPIIGYFALEGLLDRFLLTFRMGHEYVSFRTRDSGWQQMFTIPIWGLRRGNPAVLAFGLAGFVGVLAGRFGRQQAVRPTYALAVWFFVAVLEAGITRINFTHYHLLVVPPLCLLAAPVAVNLYRRLRGWLSPRSTWLRVPVLGLVVAGVLFAGYKRNLKLMRYWARYQVGIVDYETYLRRGWFLGEDLIRVQRLADYIVANTDPEDRIYYWSGDMQLYYVSGRRCAADFIWPIDAESSGAPAKIFAPTTRYILVGQNKYLPVPDWLRKGLDRDYVLETVIDEQRIYRRRDAAPGPGVAGLLEPRKSGT